MRRISVSNAVLVGTVVAIEAFFGGLIVQREFLNPTTQPAQAAPAQPDTDPKARPVPTEELQRQLAHSTSDLQLLGDQLVALRSQITEGFVRDREVTVTQSHTAYWLVEPKLMLSVTSLHGGPILAHFGTETHFFAVGQRVDFRIRDCHCYLLLTESVMDRATFNFGCERGDPDMAPLQLEL